MSQNFPEWKREMILQNTDSPKQGTLKKKKKERKKSPCKHILMQLQYTKDLRSSRKERQITYNKASFALTDFTKTIKGGKCLKSKNGIETSN